jgi:hypothetical protein
LHVAPKKDPHPSKESRASFELIQQAGERCHVTHALWTQPIHHATLSIRAMAWAWWPTTAATYNRSCWDSPAFAAGLTLGTKIVAINGEEYSTTLLRQGLRDSVDRKRPLSLIIKQQQRYRVITLDYSGGIRYPRLEKAGEGESSLDRLLTSRTGDPQ